MTMTPADRSRESGSWHYGLIARYWDECNVAEPEELDYYRAAIERFGQPALDLACGTGRLMRPLLAAGLDVDGVDISADMLALCATRATAEGLHPVLVASAMHELDLDRRYRTIYVCDSFGIGGRRDRDREALRRIHGHLVSGGALLMSVALPYDGRDETSWARWLPGHREDLPRPWGAGERRRLSDGDEIELDGRLAALDPVNQRHRLEMRARLWREDKLVAEESASLEENLYFPSEVRLMLEIAGFGDVAIEGRYTGRPPSDDETTVVIVARA